MQLLVWLKAFKTNVSSQEAWISLIIDTKSDVKFSIV